MNMIACIPISTQEHEDSFSLKSEPEVLIHSLRMYQGFLIEKSKTYPGWREANEIQSQIAERLIERIKQAVNTEVELFAN